MDAAVRPSLFMAWGKRQGMNPRHPFWPPSFAKSRGGGPVSQSVVDYDPPKPERLDFDPFSKRKKPKRTGGSNLLRSAKQSAIYGNLRRSRRNSARVRGFPAFV